MVKTVLIADDNAFVRPENGRKAIEEAHESKPDLIVLDLSMPVMNGLDAARVLKRLMPEVPIVMFSAYDDSFTEKEARSTGVSVLVSKFADISALVGIARNLVYPTRLDHLSAA